jgi:adenylate cyclase
VTTDGYVQPEWAMATIAFVDIRGFTTFAERAGAREAVEYLNAFYAVVVPVLHAHGGQVNQLLGDGVLAAFGAPGALPDHADRALAAAIDLLDATEAAMGERCRIGIGVNSGLVLVGTMGTGAVWHIGVVGDPVNVAARVQDAARDLGERLLVTEATRVLLDRDSPELAPRGTLTLKGKMRAIAVHGLAGDPVTLRGRSARTTKLR